MNAAYFILGGAAAVCVFGAYFIGWFRGQRLPTDMQTSLRNVTSGLTWRGVGWAVALPAFWVLLLYTFIAHVWFSLGRWPRFNERLDGRFIAFHEEAIGYCFWVLVASLCVAPLVLVGCLFLRRHKHVSVYALCYGAAVGLAFCALLLAPHEFLNWFLD